MSSMLEEITTAEQQAEAIRQHAATTARETITMAHTKAKNALSEADNLEREKTRAALSAAELDGNAMSKQMLQRATQAAEARCSSAQSRMDEAVAYIIKRVTENT